MPVKIANLNSELVSYLLSHNIVEPYSFTTTSNENINNIVNHKNTVTCNINFKKFFFTRFDNIVLYNLICYLL